MVSAVSSKSMKSKKVKKVVSTKYVDKNDVNVVIENDNGTNSKAAAKDSLSSYSTGGLSSLFGKEVGVVNASSVIVGEKIIKKKVKTGKTKSKKSDNVESQDDLPTKTESGEKPDAEKAVSDRTLQRVNRKKGKEGMTADEKKLTVFVGNVSVSTPMLEVKKLFAKCGAVDSIRRRGLIPTKESGTKRVAHLKGEVHEKQESVCYYVKFKEESTVAKALKLNSHDLEGHRLRVDTVEGKKDYDKNLTVYLGNLPFDTTESALVTFFEQNVGPVSFTRIVRDAATGMGKGFGFIMFKESSHVDLAIGMAGLEFQKRELRITKLMKKNKLAKVHAAQKKGGSTPLKASQPSKIDNYKFSTRKDRSEEQNARRGLKKSAKKAIKRKTTQKKGRSLMQ